MGGGFRPRLAPTLITLPVVLICLALGFWQIERLHWKEGLIARREAALAAPPEPPPATGAAAAGLEYHRVVVTGEYLRGKDILRHAIGPKGEAGFDVLTPLREQRGPVVLVVRGFVASDRPNAAPRPPPPPAGTVGVTGVLRLPPDRKPGWFVPDNRPQRAEWFWIDLPAIEEAESLGSAAPYYIDATSAALPPLPNNHLQYALTWFSLAAAGVVIYVVSQRTRTDGR